MIELEGLTKRYGEKVAVNNLTFTVRPGIVTGFLGPNGAGKSTTMRMMLGLDRPTAGDVRIDGQRYDRLKDPLKYIGALLDAQAMHGGRSAFNHLLCLAQSNGIPRARPAVAVSRPRIIRIVVDLPAPFGPRKPVTWPAETVRSRASTARVSP